MTHRVVLVFALGLVCVAAGPATRCATSGPTPDGSEGKAAPTTRVVFLVDATGSMISSGFDEMRTDVIRRVNELTPTQSFNVIVFQDDTSVEAPALTLQPATPAAKKAAVTFLEQTSAHGPGDEITAMRIAAAQGAEEVWFFTDGSISMSWPRLLDEAEQLAKAKSFRINTTLSWRMAGDADDALIILARRTGGVCLDAQGNPVPASRTAVRIPPGHDDPPAKPGATLKPALRPSPEDRPPTKMPTVKG